MYDVRVEEQPLDIAQDNSWGIFNACILTPGIWRSEVNGEVEVTKEHVTGIPEAYNKRLSDTLVAEKSKQKLRGRIARFIEGSDLKVDDLSGVQVLVDHDHSSADAVKGYLHGPVELRNADTDKPEIWGKVKVLGSENVTKVRDGRYHRLSPTFNSKTLELIEVSFVRMGACADARIEDDKINTPILLSASKTIDKERIVTENGDIKSKLITFIHKGLSSIDQELLSLRQQIEVTREARVLLAKGKLLPKHYRGELINTLMLMGNHKDRLRALQILDMVAPQVDYGVHTNNLNAMMGAQMVLEADPKIKRQADKFFKNTYAELKGKSEAEKQDILVKLKSEGYKLTEDKKPGVELNEGAENDSDRYMAHMEEMLEAGKVEELKAELKERRMKHLAAKEGKEDLNKAEKEEAKEKEEKLSAAKEDLLVALQAVVEKSTEEVKVMLSKAMEDHKVVLNKFMDDNKELVQLAATVNKGLNEVTSEETK